MKTVFFLASVQSPWRRQLEQHSKLNIKYDGSGVFFLKKKQTKRNHLKSSISPPYRTGETFLINCPHAC